MDKITVSVKLEKELAKKFKIWCITNEKDKTELFTNFVKELLNEPTA